MKLSTWARQAGVHPRTAYRWFHAGRLPVAARQLGTGTILVDPPAQDDGDVAVYARGFSADQRADLDRQVAGVVAHATTVGLAPSRVVAEVGSALNGSRPKLGRLRADPAVSDVRPAVRARVGASPRPTSGGGCGGGGGVTGQMATVVQAYRFALDPTPRQARMLASHVGAARFVFNRMLAEVKADLDRYHAGEPTLVEGWSLAALRRTWNAHKNHWAVSADTGKAWWPVNSKEAYSSGLAGLADHHRGDPR